jgi:processive 1,2-diacylglycerol beta-glucosyltransferase
MSRILILYASVGTGHRRAAEALAQACLHQPVAAVRVEDVLDHTPRLFRTAYARSYLEITDRAPLFWGYFYTQTNADPNLAEITNNLRKLVESIGTNGLKEVLRDFRPDVIICTHFLPMELLVRLRRNARLTQPIYCIITDYVAHTFWTYTEIDGYFVGNEQTRDQLIARGVMHQQIVVSGIPIDPSFSRPNQKETARQRRNIELDTSLITIFSGGIDPGHIRTIVTGILKQRLRATIAVIAGRNPRIQQALAQVQPTAETRIEIYGNIDFVDDMLTASDLVVTKAGGLIITEAMARTTPLIVVEPIPGQEEWNADFVVSCGAGVQLRQSESVPHTVQHLLERAALRDEMRHSAYLIARPQAAASIVASILARVAEPQPEPRFDQEEISR